MGRSEVETPGDLVPVDLRCAHKEGPLSVEIDRARFSWRVAGPGAERRQTAYQVLVGHADEAHSGSAELVWDSRRVESDDPSDVAYAGAPLETAHRYWWKVRVWDEAMRPSSYSAAAVFETALGTDDWEAVLIGLGPNDKPYEPPSGHGPVDHVILAMEPAPYFRCEFVLDKAVQMARLYATALGTYKVSINGPQVLEPRFTFHGFRYAEITGLSGELGQGAITACVVGSDIPRTGYFECSEADVNRLFANIDWSQRDNFLSIPTDCPQRNERLGWLGDAQIFVRTAAYNRDVASFFSKWLDDVTDAQLPSGAFPDFAPLLGHNRPGAPAWGDAGVVVPWTIYKMYGDKGVLERKFQAMTAWMDFLDAANPDRLRTRGLGNNYGDWLAPKGDLTPRTLLATAYWAYDATLMAEAARVLGRPGQAARYDELAQQVRDAFVRQYVDGTGRLTGDTQTGYVLALHMDLVGEDLRPVLAAQLVEAIAREEWHLSTGFVGVGYLLPVLSSTGHNDVAYRLLEQRSFPSWLYTVDRGATTIWERWDGWTEERGFQSPRMNSFNHYSLGSVGEWLYRFVLGIELAPGAAGFSRLVLRPYPGGSLTFARGSFYSVRGEIATSWALEGGRITFSARIPPNVQARVCIPSAEPSDVVDGDGRGPTRVEDYPGQTGQREAVFEIGSGDYSFSGAALSGH